jgi:hypothetical protein
MADGPGLYVFPEHFQIHGVKHVLDNIQSRIPCSSITTQAYVMEPSNGSEGHLEPPQDAGDGDVRMLDRELWGKRRLRVTTAPSFSPDPKLYTKTRYNPPQPTHLTMRAGEVVAAAIAETKARGMKVYIQIQAACPPGYRVQFGQLLDEDVPLLPNHDAYPSRVDNNGTLASADIIEYGKGLIQDLAKNYPNIDGIKIDWPEYPPYSLKSVFLGFGEPLRSFAATIGIDYQEMRVDCMNAMRLMRQRCHYSPAVIDLHQEIRNLFAEYRGFQDFIMMRRLLVQRMLEEYTTVAKHNFGDNFQVIPQCFPPPLDQLSGAEHHMVSNLQGNAAIKLYTMHWPMIAKNWINDMGSEAHAKGKLSDIGRESIRRYLGFSESPAFQDESECHYPGPATPHPASDRVIREKILSTRSAMTCGSARFIVHGYGPPSDFARRLSVTWEASKGSVEINRYSYLSDEKLDLIGQICL